MTGGALKRPLHRLRSAESDRLFKAVADPTRRAILELLAHQELPLMHLEERFDMSRPALIKHLGILKSGKLVETRKEGRRTLHRLNPRPLRVIRDWAAHFESFWSDHLARLKQQVEADK